MRAVVTALGLAALVAAGGAVQAKPKLTPQERLDKLLEGRTAGKPTTCISSADTRDMEVFDGIALVYRSGSTLWVNRPTNPEKLDSDDILVVRPTGSQLCRLDMVQTVDRMGHFTTGFINLSDFVPYRRTAQTTR